MYTVAYIYIQILIEEEQHRKTKKYFNFYLIFLWSYRKCAEKKIEMLFSEI
jgi:hypothetical protein